MDVLRKTVGRVLMVGVEAPELTQQEARRLTALAPAGLILFSRNLVTPPQTSRLLIEARRCLSAPSLLAVDQEGGRVSRLAPWIGKTASARELAHLGTETVGAFGAATADALVCLGFNLDFAPVIDLSSARATNGIGDRSFSTDPDRAARCAGAFLDELQSRGVAGCIKHFPGLGETTVDSHHSLPVVPASRELLESREIAPYRRLLARAASVMVAHAHYPAFDPDETLPASASPALVRGLLREKLGYGGLVVSDDLEMGAVREIDQDGAYAVRSIEAGCDLLLYCAGLDRAEAAAAALFSEASSRPSFRERLNNAARRVDSMAAAWPVPTPRLEPLDAVRAAFDGFRPADTGERPA